ncbi:hypothetical protein HY375_01565 [Candidatus Berkelbacteria bacterium]|nr:hypothetical protein [Candidatus Berkelbacteria bacterium]
MRPIRRWLGLLIITPLVLTGCFGGGTTPTPTDSTEPAANTIEIWRPFESEEVFNPILASMEASNEGLDLVYRQIPIEEYDLRINEALASEAGPDIISIPSDALDRYKDRLVPAPEGVIPSNTRTAVTTNTDALAAFFAPVVRQDVMRDDQIYGLPLYVDTLAIYVNPALVRARAQQFDRAERREEAEFLKSFGFNTYDRLITAIELLTERRTDGSFEVAGLAAGTSSNVRAAADIVSAMMLQNGTQMLAPDDQNATFHLAIDGPAGAKIFRGTEALTRYTSFADPANSFYTWNASMPDDVQAFLDGKVAMIFGYQYYELLFRQLAPTFSYAVVPFPQIADTERPVDYGSYWVEVVTKSAENPGLTWGVLAKLGGDFNQSFLDSTGRPSPRPTTDAIPSTIGRASETKSPFSYQPQTATSWRKGKRPDRVDNLFRDMIRRVSQDGEPAQTAIEATAKLVTEQSLQTEWP